MLPNPWNDGNSYQEDFWDNDDKPHLPTGLVWYILGALALVAAGFLLAL